MRRKKSINADWKFIHKNTGVEESINLPHTWNAVDGQDGGNDYYRGKCRYVKSLEIPAIYEGEKVYLEFCGVNSSADVYVNDKHLARHDGGYSIFRVDITASVGDENTLVVDVDNSSNRTVYPQKADFTFYGGIYRDVNLIIVPENHFSLEYYGSLGLQVTPKIINDRASVHLKAKVQGSGMVRYTINGVGSVESAVVEGEANAAIEIPNVRLWHGLNDPYLYTAAAELLDNGAVIDKVEATFGCRSFDFDKDKGFILNGKLYPLHGVSRHQDYIGVGNAITKEIQDEDMAFLLEIGATTVRLAHYQHDQYFYDLCDAKGLVVWAEIPYITAHMEEANANTISQLTELIMQNYNHPSIICWGLSNEITAMGGESQAITLQHTILNDLAHKLDSTRPTAMAHAFMLEIDSDLIALPDLSSYNLYFGWYLGNLEDNDDFFDTYNSKYPDRIMGMAEYGADGNTKLHSPTPERGDYTEEYQALYHEHMLRMIEKRPYLWATHVWNMFDFYADGRDEGGEHGLNQKGLVTSDRKIRKDAFYLYKAHWSKEPFVHVCGRRYVDRAEEVTQIKVYSNCPTISLFVDGTLFESQEGEKIFCFDVPISATHTIEARFEGLKDTIEIRKVLEPNSSYALPQAAIINWFNKDEAFQAKEGFFSIKDTLGAISETPEGAMIIEKLMSAARAKRGDVAQGVTLSSALQKAVNAMTVEKTLKMVGDSLGQDFITEIVKAIMAIKKP